MTIENLCPVCGYEMEAPPRNYRICPSCGTEFGVHDENASLEELRDSWIKTGPSWWSQTDPQPPDWNPFAQLAQLGLASGPIIQTTAVLRITSTTSSPIKPVTSWLGSAGQEWAQPANMRSS
jgi:hypothetical protein